MHQLIEYILRLSGSLIAMYLFYWIVLSRLTFYSSNRWYLLGYSMLAFLIPLINVSPVLEQAEISDHGLLKLIPVLGTESLYPADASRDNGQQNWSYGLLLLSAGSATMLIRFLLQYLSLRRVRKSSTLFSDGDIKLYHVDKDIVPFSFGNSIFINPAKHTDEELTNIIRHEFIHVRQKHTFDIVWSECLCILNWYNPFAWLIRHAIRQNLEYIADNKVLQNGINRKEYQYLLLKVIGTREYTLANNLNFTSLKKRIAMMNKIRSAKVHLVKFLFILPVLSLMLLAFRHQIEEQPKAISVSQLAFGSSKIVNDTVPPAEPAPQIFSVVKPNSKGYVITMADNNGECIVIIKDKQKKIVKAVTLVDWNKNEKEYSQKYGDIVPAPPAHPVIISNVPEAPEPPGGQPQMPESVSSIHVKDKKLTVTLKNGVTEVYDLDIPEQKAEFEKSYGPVDSKPPAGRKEQKPAIIIDSIPVVKPQPASRKVSVSVRTTNTVSLNLDTAGNRNEPVIIIDGKESTYKAFQLIDPNTIESMEVMKGESAGQEYGEKARNGVIKIITRPKSN